MGVLGLYSYFDSKSLGQRRSWATNSATNRPDSDQQDAVSNHSVAEEPTPTPPRRYFIIDGNAYIHHLYCGQFEWIFGGQYSSFVTLLTAHIRALQSCGFHLKVLFDGPLPLQKLRTRVNRDTEKIHKMNKVVGDLEHYRVLRGAGSRISSHFLIPPLVMEVTLQTLRSLGVDLMVCDGEADGLVAQLATEKSLDEGVDEAYAISKDSDYFIYNTGSSTKGGYIPLDNLFVSTNPISHTTTITVTVYSQSAISDHLGIQPRFLPLFASLTGNDYLRPDVFEDQIAKSLASATGQRLSAASNTNHARIRATAGFLKEYGAGSGSKSDPEAKLHVMNVMNRILEDRKELYPSEGDEKREGLRSALEESIEQYSPSITSSESNLTTAGLLSNTSTTGLDKIKEALRSGQFSFKLMDVVCNRMFWCTPFLEDTDRESAWLVSREMRRWIYGILARNLNIDKTGAQWEAGQKEGKKDSDGDDESALDVVEYVRRGDHLSAEIITGASRLELDEVLKSARAKAKKRTTRRVSVMDVDTIDFQAPEAEDLHKTETMSIDINLGEEVEKEQDKIAQLDIKGEEDVLELDEASRTSLFLEILGADTAQVRALPKQFLVLAATLRYLINALAHSKTRSNSSPIANFEIIAFVASVLFLREKYYPETIPSLSTTSLSGDHQQLQQAVSIPSQTSPPVTPSPLSHSLSGTILDEAPPLTKRSLHLSTQYQHTLSTVALLANALYLEDILPSLASLYDGLLFQQTLALARGGTLLEQRMQHPESVAMYHRILAAVEEDFVDTGEIDVVVVFRATSGKKSQQQQQLEQQEHIVSLGIFGPDMEPVNQLASAQAFSSSSGSSLKAAKSTGVHKKSSGSSKKRNGGGGGSSSGGGRN
ncbi:hypothetical protein EDD21DRAFT_333178, partial [Dissophora ornata]